MFKFKFYNAQFENVYLDCLNTFFCLKIVSMLVLLFGMLEHLVCDVCAAQLFDCSLFMQHTQNSTMNCEGVRIYLRNTIEQYVLIIYFPRFAFGISARCAPCFCQRNLFISTYRLRHLERFQSREISFFQTYFLVSHSFRNFVQSTTVSLPCTVQNFKAIRQLKRMLWRYEVS